MAKRTVYKVNGYTVEVFEYSDKYAYDITAPSGMSMGGGGHNWEYVLGRIFELCIEPRGVTEEIDDVQPDELTTLRADYAELLRKFEAVQDRLAEFE